MRFSLEMRLDRIFCFTAEEEQTYEEKTKKPVSDRFRANCLCDPGTGAADVGVCGGVPHFKWASPLFLYSLYPLKRGGGDRHFK